MPPTAKATPAVEPASAHEPVRIRQVLIGKRDRTYAEVLGSLCSQVFPGAVLLTRDSGSSILHAFHAHDIDLLILGLSFHDMSAIDLLHTIRQSGWSRLIAIITEQRDGVLLPALQNARVDAVIDTNTESISAIKDALRLVSERQMYVSPALRPYIIDRLPLPGLRHDLTAGEMRVIQIIGTGSDNQEAADMLGLSEATVQTHRRNIMRKLKVSTSAKLVREAIRLGLARVSPAEDAAL